MWALSRARGQWPHEVIPGLSGLSQMSALRFAASVYRSRLRWRKYQVDELLRQMNGDKDPMGVGRVISLLAGLLSEG
jgi:hypothetical protein